MKTLSADMLKARRRLYARPYNIVKFEWGGSVGDKWYSDRASGSGNGSSISNLADRVVDWGTYRLPQAEGRRAAAIADITITLRDEDGVIRSILQWRGHQRIPATVYQCFVDTGVETVTLVDGVAVAPFQWRETDATVAIDITERAHQFNQVIGTMVTKDDWPYLDADQSAMLPIVFGRVHRRKAFLLEGTVETSLAAPLRMDEEDLFVNDSEDFPQYTAINLWLDGESIRGRFKGGNQFYTDARGDNSYSGRLTDDSDHLLELRCTTLPPPISQYIGLSIRISFVDFQGSHGIERQIIGTDPDISALYINQVILASSIWGPYFWFPQRGASFEIDGEVREHAKGTRVLLKRDRYTWVLNDQPSKNIIAVEGSIAGVAKNVPTRAIQEGYFARTKPVVELVPTGSYAAIEPARYTVKLNAADTIPGRVLTVIRMTVLPTMIGPDFAFRSDDLYVTFNGAYDAGGATIKSPPDVIRQLGYRYLGMVAGDFDQPSFEAAKNQLTWCHFGFMLQEQYQGLDLFADLAMQARCMLTWEGGIARLQYLREGPFGPPYAGALTDAEREAWSMEVYHETPENVVTEVLAEYTRKGRKTHYVTQSAGAMAAYGRRVLSLNLWAHNQVQTVRPVAEFWLERLCHAHERVRASTFLRLLEIERGDALAVSVDDVAISPAEVMSLSHHLGNAPQDRMDNMTFDLRLPRWGGCESTCEMPCEVDTEVMATPGPHAGKAGCELGCTYHCQSTCEEACELTCVSGYELLMVRDKEEWLAGCVASCQVDCTTACATACQVSCESRCETGCEVYCETTCESGCEIYCESGCETECESACETACQVMCESECESGCEMGCESGCETECESGCETGCELGCEVYCQTGCESSCEVGCESDCETGCEAMCQSTCETGCETSCETGCETSCETGCEVTCETGCETSCETGCEVTCETGCEVTCETGCEVGCETGCQVSCEVSCTAGGVECCELPCWCHSDPGGLGSPYLEACKMWNWCPPWTTGNCTYIGYSECITVTCNNYGPLPWEYWYESNNCVT